MISWESHVSKDLSLKEHTAMHAQFYALDQLYTLNIVLESQFCLNAASLHLVSKVYN